MLPPTSSFGLEKDSSYEGCAAYSWDGRLLLMRRSGAAIKANPSRGGGAKPKGLHKEMEAAGLPNGRGVTFYSHPYKE
jgi:hypothetical protein